MNSVIYKVFLSVTCAYVLKTVFKLIKFDKIKSILVVVAVRFYKAVLNTELAKTEALLIGEMQGQVRVSFWAQHFCQPVNT